ncbi:hypothetical protein L208DRAFT_1235494, partial [Tricholoma matsutake]
LPEIPSKLIVETFITSKEEHDMGIDHKAILHYRERYSIPNTDGIEEMRKRDRGDSNVSTQPPRKTIRSLAHYTSSRVQCTLIIQ